MPRSFTAAALIILLQTLNILHLVIAPTPSAIVEVKLNGTGRNPWSRTLWNRGESTTGWKSTRKELQRFPRSPLRRPGLQLASAPRLPRNTGETVQMYKHFRMKDTGSLDSPPEEATFSRSERSDPRDTVPAVSFHRVEENIIELLVVVTPRMNKVLGKRLTEYIIATMGAVGQNFKHPSLQVSLKISIVDILLLDSNFARRQRLEDWSNRNHEEVMGKFCKWANTLRQHRNWDSAILLNVGNFKSTALGVAHYQAMCSQDSGCLVVVDRGFGTADIIAHELGHQLGAKHDFEIGSECGLSEDSQHPDVTQRVSNWLHSSGFNDPSNRLSSRNTLMSGILNFELYPFRWSACSRASIQHFLSKPDSSCLRTQNSKRTAFTPDVLSIHSTRSKPGLNFTLHEQCELAVRQRGSKFCGQAMPVCKQLYCFDLRRGICLAMEAPWAEGSSCGHKKWCISGSCLPTSELAVPVHGGWSNWSEWGACSRKCGGGVQYSARECNSPVPQFGGDFCLGTNIQVRSCNLEACASSTDIRQELCDEVGAKVGLQLKAYNPKFGESSACKLVCLNGSKALQHKMNLPDGTPCFPPRNDICIQGTCWKTGCNRVLGSRMRTDNCNVCGGDNSTCEAITGVFRGSHVLLPGVKPVGLTTAVHIPHGVTNVYIRKVSRRTSPFSVDAYDDYMLLILEELKTRIRRGETHEEFAGAELYYSGSRQKEEIVKITGQLLKDVNILIRVENKDTDLPLPEVEYTYYVSKTDTRDQLRFEPAVLAALRERPGDALIRYQRSSRAQQSIEKAQNDPAQPRPAEGGAGGGYNVNQNLRLAVTTITPTTTTTSAQKSANRFVWRMDDVPGRCTSCVGLVESHASCYAVIAKPEVKADASASYNFLKPLPPEFCDESIRPAPAVYNCADFCGVRWKQKPDYLESMTTTISLADRGESVIRAATCSSRCGPGSREIRLVPVCEEKVKVGKLPSVWRKSQLGDLACIKAGLGEAPKPVTEVVHCVGQCLPVHWNMSEWSNCSNQCGVGIASRKIACLDSSGIKWPPAECGKSMPEEVDTDSIEMVPLEAKESRKCFETAGCRDELAWSVSEWSECRVVGNLQQEFCSSSFARYIHATRKTQEVEWNRPNYLPGLQMRTIICVMRHSLNGSETRVPDEYCQRISNNTPIRSQSCPNPICHRWGTVRFHRCSADCGTGTQVGELSCERVHLSASETHPDNGVTVGVTEVSAEECHRHILLNISLVILPGFPPTVFSLESQLLPHLPKLPEGARTLSYTPGELIQLPCSLKPCSSRKPTWTASSWSKCSVACGNGYQQRTVSCVLPDDASNDSSRTKDNSPPRILPDEICLERSLPRPSHWQVCEGPPCAFWKTEEWGECKGTCEGGLQKRRVRCLQTSPTTSVSNFPVNIASDVGNMTATWEVEPSMCEGQEKPEEKRLCPLSNDCPFWYTGPWSACSAPCGYGIRYRQVDCRYPNGTVVYQFSPERGRKLPTWPRCSSQRPLDRTECRRAPCGPSEAFWRVGVLSRCSAVGCSYGYQERAINCLTADFRKVEPEYCGNNPPPPSRVPCTQSECKSYRWRVDPWSRCPYVCRLHRRHRRVQCVDDLGEEYADRFCQRHLRPDSWGMCPDLCPTYPTTCWDLKRQQPNATDGVYELLVHRKLVKIYCSDMTSSYPREYLPLGKLNYATFIADEKGPPSSERCHGNLTTELTNWQEGEKYTSTDMYFAKEVTRELEEDLDQFMEDLFKADTPSNPENSVTMYRMIRIYLQSLEVDVFDTRFAETRGKRTVPYGTAKSCSALACGRGQFVINLAGTGFSVSKETQWRSSQTVALSSIRRYTDMTLVEGTCGGNCGGCWPDPFLRLSTSTQWR
uniref:A disintegrin and metalloproteinase with thrombospondin motifs 1 n=1 Tax=Schistocephalus solidus TaxID=70667 RepID=A0A0X3NSN5_SCHSO